MSAVKAYAVIIALRLLSWLPLGVARALGRSLGRVLWQLNGQTRKVTEENLALCFPAWPVQQRAAVARRSLQGLGMTGAELGAVWHWPLRRLLAKIEAVEGEQLLEQALADPRGLVVLGPHLGNWELLGLYLATRGPITSMYQPPDWPALDRLMQRTRTRSGSMLAPTSAAGIKTLLQALKRGEMVGVLPDQTPPLGHGEFAPFFGVPALTQTLAPNLLRRTGARVLVAAALATASGFRLCFLPVDEGIYNEDPAQAAAALNRSVEAIVLRAPEQYQWEYKRFRRQPGGARPYYRYK